MYILEFFEFSIDLGFNEVEDVGSAGVLSGNGVEFIKRADCKEADEEGSENDCFHFN
jgi:hypothetical protein